MYCPNCGKEIKDGAVFCSNCGYSKNKNIEKNKGIKLPKFNKKIITPILVVLGVLALGIVIYNAPKSKGKVYEFSRIRKVKTITEYFKNKNYDNFTVDKFDTVKFGSYPQSDSSGNTKEPIEWIILDRQSDKALLLSKYIIDAKYYDNTYKKTAIAWEICGLRNWLNNDFYYNAFSDSEQSKIQATNVINDYSNVDGIYGGNDTIDKIFLLSYEEVRDYFKKQEAWQHILENKPLTTKATNFAKAINYNGDVLYVSKDNDYWYSGNSSFWLRTPGSDNKPAQCVVEEGYFLGEAVSCVFAGVRPALWVSFK